MSKDMDQVVNALIKAEYLPKDWQDDEESDALPISAFIRVMTIIGAWLTTACILAVYFLVSIDDIKELEKFSVLLTAGAILMMAMFLILPIHEFSRQLRFSFSLVGQGLVILGAYFWLNNIYIVLILVIAFESLLAWIYREAVLIFIACWVTVFSLALLCELSQWINGIHLLVALTAAVTVGLPMSEAKWALQKHHEFLNVAQYAAATGLLIILLPSVHADGSVYAFHLGQADWWISGLFLMAAGVSFEYELLKQWKLSWQSTPALVVFAATILLGVFGLFAPAVIAGLLVYSLGFYRNDRFLQIIALIYTVVSAAAFLHSVEIPLFHKSLMLIFTGIMAWVAYYGLGRSWLKS